MKIPHKYKIVIYITGLLVIIGALLVLGGVFNPVEGFYIGWSDNFDSYDDESLLSGQGGWIMTGGSIRVSNDRYYSAPNGIKRDSIEPYFDKRGEEIEIGSLSFKFYDTGADNGSAFFLTNKDGSSGGFTFYIVKENETITIFYDNTWAKRYTTGLALNAWHTASVEWNNITDYVRIKIDGLAWSEWFNLLTGYPTKLVGGFSVRYGYGSDVFYDDFSVFEGEPYLTDPFVWGDTPASGTIITDLNSVLTIGYEGLESWDSLYINLRNLETGINTDTRYFKVSEIGSSGELEINLQEFNIEKNANWYLYANAVYEGYVYESGFLKGTGYTWSDNLTDGDYYLTITATELQDMFVMESFESWYGNNVDRFDDPTEMFSSIAGFLQPIFSAIGEYGHNIRNYFDLENSYIKGFEIGKIIPVFNYYLDEISLFLGGFPLIKWFFIVSFILIGIFIFKLIFKFIPFLG